MCGISGIFFKEMSSEHARRAKDAVSRMDEVQFPRGPDDGGIYEFPGGAFGHRRLSIIDLSSAGHQPMSYDGDLWITFNGEIYNFAQLKTELQQKGNRFKTGTDTEVILALYKQYGESAFAKMRGIFAFAIWDGNARKLILARDHYGVKPLYYYESGDRIVFASTVKALTESGEVPVVQNSKALIGFLLFGSVPSPETTLQNVRALPAGSYLVTAVPGRSTVVRYHNALDAFAKKASMNSAEAVEETKSRLREAVRLNLVSDAPLGVFLSGGLDSSALACLAAAGRTTPLTTLSVTFDEREYSEEIYQKAVVERIRSDHREVRLRKADFLASLDDVFAAMDQPTVDGANTFFVSKAAKEAGLKVVLSGLGGDELFFGYPYFRLAKKLLGFQKLPSFVKGAVNSVFAAHSRFSKLSYLKDSGMLGFYLSFRGFFTPRTAAQMLAIPESDVWEYLRSKEVPWPDVALSAEDLVSYLELSFYMQNQLLKDTDFMSMAHSIEARVPFLDWGLVNYASSIPSRVKMGGTWNKPLLIEAVKDIVPRQVYERKKMGFTFPFGVWLKSVAADLATAPASRPLLKSFLAGQLHWSRFWAAVVLSRFLPK